ncbi:hypothetical protein QNH46_20650 [Paenibacillus woosongensis]|uniref:Uncharacterized protein n=1 Tax=Paenibacillus woosongensis TaxID=307580 RepID=A0AA95I9T7_9BACL|nr:hypothetical protein [Paenibacillus woosongensis]WHX48455.1 hypothetical protein QNH46_20650 [Paenibacillus woosongensis]
MSFAIIGGGSGGGNSWATAVAATAVKVSGSDYGDCGGYYGCNDYSDYSD